MIDENSSLDNRFPPNSHKERVVREERKVERVTKGKVIQRKKSLGKRFIETFIGEEVDNVGSYIIHDVLIPAAKATITDMVQGGIEMLLFGERKSSRSSYQNRGNTNYASMSKVSYKNSDRRDYNNRNRSLHDFNDIVLTTRDEAVQVRNHLLDLLEEYNQASVADLYDLIGITSHFTDNRYGWYNLRDITISRVRDGYLLNLPKPVILD